MINFYMSMMNKIALSFMPILPKSLVYQFAKRYVAGTTKETALNAIEDLNNKGFVVTLDILGEHTQTRHIATEVTSDYIDLYKQIHSRKLDCNISLKPSHIGSDISEEVYNENLQKIINISEETNNFVRIDMESSKATDFTIKSFVNEKNKGFNIGTVFQAYLYSLPPVPILGSLRL